MPDDFDELSNGAAGDETPDFDLGDVAPAKAEPAEPTVEAALEAAFDERTAGTDDAKSESAWAREHRKLADAAIAAAGIDPSERHSAGISRREATRRLFRAEAMVRRDLAEGVSAIIQSYGGALPVEQRGVVGQRVLQALGFEAPGQIAEQDRQRLQQYDAWAQEQRTAYERAMPGLQQKLNAFATQHEHFETVRQTMAGLMQAAREGGEPIDLPTAYAQACRARGLATSEDTARAADAARVAKVAAARAAGTPQTKSAPGMRHDRAGPDRGVGEILEQQWDALVGG